MKKELEKDELKHDTICNSYNNLTEKYDKLKIAFEALLASSTDLKYIYFVGESERKKIVKIEYKRKWCERAGITPFI